MIVFVHYPIYFIETPFIVKNITNQTTLSLSCNIASKFGVNVIYWINLFSFTIFYILMGICTILLVATILKSKLRTNFNVNTFRRDLRFFIIRFTLNLIYIGLTLLVFISTQKPTGKIPNSANIYVIETCIFCLS